MHDPLCPGKGQVDNCMECRLIAKAREDERNRIQQEQIGKPHES